jgi:hypothetical protein
MLSIRSFAHVLVGEPVSTSPEHALSRRRRRGVEQRAIVDERSHRRDSVGARAISTAAGCARRRCRQVRACFGLTLRPIPILLTIRTHLRAYHPQRESFPIPGPQRPGGGETLRQINTIAARAWQSCVAQI